MAVLSAHKRIDYVIPGKPFGSGADGNATIGSNPNTRDTASGSSGATTLTTGGATFANGDILLIHQTRGTNAGQWEIVKVASGGGSSSLTLSKPLVGSYVTSGNNAAQAVKIPQYDAVTVNAHTITAWNGSVGGIEVIAGKTSITVSGAIAGSGGTSTVAQPNGAGGSGGGFRGGEGRNSAQAFSGEGTSGASTQTSGANGNGGGGGPNSGDMQSGGGGGHASAGGNGNGTGGSSAGAADLTTMVFGGGGGGSKKPSVNNTTGGGGGGGIVVLISKSITLSAGVAVNGGKAADGGHGGGGGGAGGSILMVCINASLGTNQATSTAGAGGSGDNGSGPSGSAGRIAIHHSGTVTGTTNPTFYDQSDASLKEGGAAGNPMFFSGGGLSLG